MRPVPEPLRKKFPGLDLEKAQQQVRDALAAAVKEAGGQRPFTRKMNAELEKRGRQPRSLTAVQWWLSEGTFVDEVYWEAIEHACDFITTRRHLRPDLYGLMRK